VTLTQSVQPVDPGGATQPAQEMTLYLTNNKLRLDSGDVSSIIRADRKITYSILHADKVFIPMPHAGGGSNSPSENVEPVNARATGKTAQINGFECAQVEVEQSDGTQIDEWITRDPKALAVIDALKPWQSGGFAPVLAGLGLQKRKTLPAMEGVPVRTLVLGPDRKPTVCVEVKRLSSVPIRADLFEPPPGYKEMSMSDLESSVPPEKASDVRPPVPEKELDPHAKP
jgi:hypothetical protein